MSKKKGKGRLTEAQRKAKIKKILLLATGILVK